MSEWKREREMLLWKGLRRQIVLGCLAGVAVWLFPVRWCILSGLLTGLLTVLSVVFAKNAKEVLGKPRCSGNRVSSQGEPRVGNEKDAEGRNSQTGEDTSQSKRARGARTGKGVGGVLGSLLNAAFFAGLIAAAATALHFKSYYLLGQIVLVFWLFLGGLQRR